MCTTVQHLSTLFYLMYQNGNNLFNFCTQTHIHTHTSGRIDEERETHAGTYYIECMDLLTVAYVSFNFLTDLVVKTQ